MKRYLLALALIATVALIATGCAQEAPEEEMVTGQVTSSSSTPQIRLEPATADNVVRDYEVLMRNARAEDDDCTDEEAEEDEDCQAQPIAFFPQTFNANEGDVVKLTFLFQEPYFISIEGLGIAEDVQTDTIAFVAEEAGVYDVQCLDCEENPIAQIVIR